MPARPPRLVNCTCQPCLLRPEDERYITQNERNIHRAEEWRRNEREKATTEVESEAKETTRDSAAMAGSNPPSSVSEPAKVLKGRKLAGTEGAGLMCSDITKAQETIAAYRAPHSVACEPARDVNMFAEGNEVTTGSGVKTPPYATDDPVNACDSIGRNALATTDRVEQQEDESKPAIAQPEPSRSLSSRYNPHLEPTFIQCIGCQRADVITKSSSSVLHSSIIKCKSCYDCSHIRCVKEQFDYVPEPGENEWKCPKCLGEELWTDIYIGTYIPLPTRPGGPLFAAIIQRTAGRMAHLAWYDGNFYGHGRRWAPISDTFILPVEACMRVISDSRLKLERRQKFGQILWPLCLVDDAYDQGYVNHQINRALQNGASSIGSIITGQHPHPVMDVWNEWKLSHPGMSSIQFMFKFGVAILPGDESLIAPVLADLTTHLSKQPVPLAKFDIRDRLMGPGFLLFQLIVVREYLQRDPVDDMTIWRLWRQGRLRRDRLPPEHALVGLLGRTDVDIGPANALFISRTAQNIIKVTKSSQTTESHNIFHVQGIDEKPYVWSSTSSTASQGSSRKRRNEDGVAESEESGHPTPKRRKVRNAC